MHKTKWVGVGCFVARGGWYALQRTDANACSLFDLDSREAFSYHHGIPSWNTISTIPGTHRIVNTHSEICCVHLVRTYQRVVHTLRADWVQRVRESNREALVVEDLS